MIVRHLDQGDHGRLGQRPRPRRFLLGPTAWGTRSPTPPSGPAPSPAWSTGTTSRPATIEGKGEVIEPDGTSHPIEPGASRARRARRPRAGGRPDRDLRLVCVFDYLRGDERHDLDSPEFSHY